MAEPKVDIDRFLNHVDGLISRTSLNNKHKSVTINIDHIKEGRLRDMICNYYRERHMSVLMSKSIISIGWAPIIEKTQRQ